MIQKKNRFEPDTTPSCSGSPYGREYAVKVHEDGYTFLEYVGEIPFDQLIQANAETCAIKEIVRRATCGDLGALNARSGEFLDLTSMPSDLMEAYRKASELKNYYDSLPVEVKGKYPNISDLAGAIDDGSFIKDHGEALGYIQKKVEANVNE